jgi:hypothetical protein
VSKVFAAVREADPLPKDDQRRCRFGAVLAGKTVGRVPFLFLERRVAPDRGRR